MRQLLLNLATAVFGVVLTASAAEQEKTPAPLQNAADYVRDVKPILIEHCSSCHGGLKQSGRLRLDTVAAMTVGGESGSVIIPGNSQDSLLMEVLRGEAGFMMPPEGQGSPPAPTEIEQIAQWIDQGASAPEGETPQADPKTYWSYQPLSPVDVPSEENRQWIRNPIDAFVAIHHKSKRLEPQPAARPHVLLRRLYLDLVGYPPTREELIEYLRDPSDAAYETIVNDLLARPQYGERWGRHWMDVWRYSDWYGRRPNNEIRYSQRHIWRWRDWIIQSLNDDKGYDRMLTEMLAGDEIAPLDNEVLAATGFLGRNWYKFDRNTWLFETVEQTSRGFLAMTMQCARCHDHKYDPIDQQEYYQFRAFFEPHGFRTDPVTLDAITEVDNGKEKVLNEGLSRAYDSDLDVPTYLFRRGDDRSPDKENPLQPGVPVALGTNGLTITPVSLPAESYMPGISQLALDRATTQGQKRIADAEKKRDETTAEIQRLEEQIAIVENADIAFSAEPFIEDDFDTIDPKRWKTVSGNWTARDGRLTESIVTSFATIVSTEDHPRNFVARVRYRKLDPGVYRSVGFSFDYVNSGRDSQDVYTSRVDGRPSGTVQAFHRIAGKQTYPKAGIRPATIEVGDWIDLEFTVRESHLMIRVNGKVHLDYSLPLKRVAGKFALWVHSGAAEFDQLSITPIVPSIPDLKNAVTAARQRLQIDEARVEHARAKAQFERARILAERIRFGVDSGDAEAAALDAHRAELKTALWKAKIEVAEAQQQLLLASSDDNRKALTTAEEKESEAARQLELADGKYTKLDTEYPKESTGRRLALAQWMTRPDHPRTSRVAVNHIWMRHFGEALVQDTDNFGLSGKEPSHPELLDWLANELIANEWRMKPLHKLIVMSATYRLNSRQGGSTDFNQRNDPNNVYLWRANSRRMEAEVVRDSLLAVAGELDLTTSGPDIDEKQGQTSHRRSLYFRTTPDNQMQMLSLFDQASPDECYRRRESVIPQQALALMNGPLAIDLSRILAGKLSQQSAQSDNKTSDRHFIQTAFETILSRQPTDEEISACSNYLSNSVSMLKDRSKLRAFPSAPQKTTVNPSSVPAQRARESLVHVLFNHNEFVTIR